jgi:DNA repair exonuclease SbcCD ATPase subunit
MVMGYDIVSQLEEAKKKLNRDRGKQSILQSQLEICKKDLKRKEFHLSSLMEARSIFQKAAQDTQAKLEEHISNLVTLALNAIFEDPYEFKLEFVQKRGKTEADLWLVRNGQKVNPMDAAGGGVVDVVSFALRLAYWSLTKKTRPIFLLDEPFKHLSADLQSSAGEMLKMLSDKLNIQIIMVSHIVKLIECSDNILRFGMEDGKTIKVR